MKITIVICTRNRAALLGRALDSICGLLRPRSAEWSVLVVANDCSDLTLEVADSFRTKLPIKCVTEPVPNLSRARNRALDVLDGDYAIWIDDDVRVDRGWLVAYEEAFDLLPGAAFFGGRIEPEFDGGPPAWILASWHAIQSAFAARSVTGPKAIIQRGELELPYGANCAVRMEAVRRHRFDIRLGRRPEMPFCGGEETAFFHSLLDDGQFGAWVPDAVLHHWIGTERQTTAYVRGYYIGQGLGSGATPWESGDTRLRAMAPLAIKRELQYWLSRLSGDPAQWPVKLKNSAWTRGAVMARLRRSASA